MNNSKNLTFITFKNVKGSEEVPCFDSSLGAESFHLKTCLFVLFVLKLIS